jgi:hypothetical protein
MSPLASTLSPHHTSLQQARPHNLSAIRHLPLVHRILMLCIHPLRRKSKYPMPYIHRIHPLRWKSKYTMPCIRPIRRKSKPPRARQHRTIQLKKQADSGSRTLSFRCRGHHNARALGPAITLPLSYKLYDGKQSFSGGSYCTNATHANPRQYNKRSQKFTSRQMVREGGFFHHSRQKRICSDVTPYPLRSWQFQSILQASMVLQLQSQEASRKWILSLEVMAKHSVQRIQQS